MDDHAENTHRFRIGRSVLMLALLTGALLAPAGCAIFGLAAQALPHRQKAAYAGLKNQTVALMVAADRGVRMDWESISIDCAAAIQAKMQKLQKEKSAAELSGVTWPYEPRSVVRFQKDHPELELTPATDIALRLNVARLIYVEINQMTTRSEQATQLFKGKCVANLRVVEVKDGKAKVAYEENNVSVTFPEKTKEGVLNADNYKIYLGTLDRFSTVIALKFAEHDID